MLKAFIFDMDGVLADSEDLSMRIGIEYFASIGIAAGREDFRPFLGMGEEGFFAGPAGKLGAEGYSYSEASAFFRSRYLEIVGDSRIALPGADIVRKAHRCGILTALASSAPRWKAMANIEAVGLTADDFDSIATGEDIKRNKPEKDIYELSLIRLGVDASEAVVFEDAAAGIESGKRASCRVIALTTTLDAASAYDAGADGVIPDLSAISGFSSREEAVRFAEEAMKRMPGGKVRYGAVMIEPLERRMPRSFTLRKAIEAAAAARENAYVPFSRYRVGAAVVSAATGRIYPGCNVENSSFGATICAERNAITTAVAEEGAIGIDMLVVFSEDDPPAPPCAACLQVIAEFSRPETEIVLASPGTGPRSYRLSQLLPMPFIFPTIRG